MSVSSHHQNDDEQAKETETVFAAIMVSIVGNYDEDYDWKVHDSSMLFIFLFHVTDTSKIKIGNDAINLISSIST